MAGQKFQTYKKSNYNFVNYVDRHLFLAFKYLSAMQCTAVFILKNDPNFLHNFPETKFNNPFIGNS